MLSPLFCTQHYCTCLGILSFPFVNGLFHQEGSLNLNGCIECNVGHVIQLYTVISSTFTTATEQVKGIVSLQNVSTSICSGEMIKKKLYFTLRRYWSRREVHVPLSWAMDVSLFLLL